MQKLLFFRRLKHAEPTRMKVLVEDLASRPWLERLSLVQFAALIAVGSIGTAAAVYAASATGQ